MGENWKQDPRHLQARLLRQIQAPARIGKGQALLQAKGVKIKSSALNSIYKLSLQLGA